MAANPPYEVWRTLAASLQTWMIIALFVLFLVSCFCSSSELESFCSLLRRWGVDVIRCWLFHLLFPFCCCSQCSFSTRGLIILLQFLQRCTEACFDHFCNGEHILLIHVKSSSVRIYGRCAHWWWLIIFHLVPKPQLSANLHHQVSIKSIRTIS
jgi:hypothetical protein